MLAAAPSGNPNSLDPGIPPGHFNAAQEDPLSTATDLATLGFRGAHAVTNFQTGYNLGTWLTMDGDDGPTTRAAIANSLARKAKGLHTASANFSFSEFSCACKGQNPSCELIWVRRELIYGLEKMRANLVGPLNIERGCRCKLANGWVKGAKNSQHLYGSGVDITVFNVPISKIIALGCFSGIGDYVFRGVEFGRHVDVRHVFGLRDKRNTTPGVTVRSPARWSYGTAKSVPVRPRPDLATQPPAAPPVEPTPTSEEDELMAITIQHPDFPDQKWGFARAVWSIWTYTLKAYREAVATRAEIAALNATVAGFIASGSSMTPEQVEQASYAGSSRALDEKIDDADVTLNVTPQES